MARWSERVLWAARPLALFIAVHVPAPAQAAEPRVRIAVISDLNGPYGATVYRPEVSAAIRRIVALRPDTVLGTGDMVAGQKASLSDATVRSMWAAFHSVVSDPLERAGIPFAPTPGNHDASGYAVHRRDRAIYIEQWAPRRPRLELLPESRFPLQYAFRLGPALLVSLDATTVSALDPPQLRWLDELLTRYADVPIKILYGHVPPFPFAVAKEQEYLRDPAFEGFLLRHGVSLYLSGHHHAYFPGKRGKLRLVGTSCLGEGPRALIGTATPSPRSFVWLELDAGGIRKLEAFAGAGFDRVISRSSLPEAIQPQNPALTVIRDDQ